MPAFIRDACPICASDGVAVQDLWKKCSDCSLVWQAKAGLQNRDVHFAQHNGELPSDLKLSAEDLQDSKIQRAITGKEQAEYNTRYTTALKHSGVVPAASKNFIEIGFGAGQSLFRAAADSWKECCGIEIDWRYVLYTQSRGLRTYYADVTTGAGVPSELERSADLIMASEVMEHVQNPRAFLAGMLELMKPNGRIWISFAKYEPEVKLTSGEWHYWTQRAVERLASTAGMAIDSIKERWSCYLVTGRW